MKRNLVKTSVKDASSLKSQNVLNQEFLQANENGAYSSSTVVGCNTRKYHGLLAAELAEPIGKYVFLSTIEEQIIYDGQPYLVNTNQFHNNIFYPEGRQYFKSFKQCYVSEFKFELPFLTLTKQLLLSPQKNTVYIVYQFKRKKRFDTKAIAFNCRPFVSFRNIHDLTTENAVLNTNYTVDKNTVTVTPYAALPSLYFQSETTYDFDGAGCWSHNHFYEAESARGYPHTEDLYSYGTLQFKSVKQTVVLAVSLEKITTSIKKQFVTDLKEKRSAVRRIKKTGFGKKLIKATQQFGYRPSQDKLLTIAGFHWFDSWGRDTMISLPGMYLTTKQYKPAITILNTYAKAEKNGLIPNIIHRNDTNHAYNSVDASLWFAWAVSDYVDRKKEDVTALSAYIWPTLKRIFHHFYNGTDFSVYLHDNGLIHSGDETTQLTWMDAMVNGRPATPRYGFVIEINALWFNLLHLLKRLNQTYHDLSMKQLDDCLDRFKQHFVDYFWMPEHQYAADFVYINESGERVQNQQCRPNQCISLALRHHLWSPDQATAILAAVQDQLYTPYGLRTLGKDDPHYKGHYHGTPEERDMAYHNGTVWPWLISFYCHAVLKHGKSKKLAKQIIAEVLTHLKSHMDVSGNGFISEIFSGDYPHQPNGCIAQAWSISECMRLLEMQTKPKYYT